MALVNVYTLGEGGFNSDVPAHELPPSVFNNAVNVAFRRGRCLHRADNRTLGFSNEVTTDGITYTVTKLDSLFFISPLDWVLCGAEITAADNTKYNTVLRYILDEGGLVAPFDLYPPNVTTGLTLGTYQPGPDGKLRTMDDVEVTAPERYAWDALDFQFKLFNKTPVFMLSGFPPMYWNTDHMEDERQTPLHTADILPGWPTFDEYDGTIDATHYRHEIPELIAVVGSHIVAMNFPDAPSKVRWSSAAGTNEIPNSWATDDPTVASGETILSKGGEAVAAELLGNTLFIFQRNYIHSMTFIGGTFIFSFQEVMGSRGAFTRECVTRIANRSLFLVTQNDVLEFNGQSVVSVIEGVCREELFNTLQQGVPRDVWTGYSTEQQEYYLYPGRGPFCFVYSTQYGVWSKSSKAARFQRAIEFQTLLPTNLTLTFDEIEGAYQAQPGSYEEWGGSLDNVGTRYLVGTWRVDDTYNRVGFGVMEAGVTYTPEPDHEEKDDVSPSVMSQLERRNLALVGRKYDGTPVVDIAIRKMLTKFWWRGKGAWKVYLKTSDELLSDESLDIQNAHQFIINEFSLFKDIIAQGRFISVEFHPEDRPEFREELHGYDMDLFNIGMY